MNRLRKIIILGALLFSLMGMNPSNGQENLVGREDSAAIRQTALDYIEGYYSGDAARMEKAIHPDLNKATPVDLPQTGRTILSYTTYSSLLEFTRAGAGMLDDTSRHIELNILGIESEVASVKVSSANFIDYIQEIRLDGEWKIVNVIFTSGTKVTPRLKDFDASSERASVERSAMNYLNGMTAGDAGRLDLAIDHEFNRILLMPVNQTGKTALRRQRYDNMIENAMAGIGKQDEVYRNNQVTVMDITDGIALARCQNVSVVEFIQLYKGNGQWKVFNSIARPNRNLTLAQAMTVTVGEPMPDFTLPVYGGGNFKLSDYLGKNVLLMFPRGWISTRWCPYCPYQYLELEQMAKEEKILSKYNLQIAFVMPYSSDRIKDWMERFPEAMATVDQFKKPNPSPAPGSIQYDYSNWVAENFPKNFYVEKDDPHTMIPVLIDEDRTLSRNLKIFTNFWDGISSEQNMASIFIIDRKGILRFKYVGQMTEDRPSVEYLLDFIDKL